MHYVYLIQRTSIPNILHPKGPNQEVQNIKRPLKLHCTSKLTKHVNVYVYILVCKMPLLV